MKSINFGTIARIFRDVRPDPEAERFDYETWEKCVREFDVQLTERNLTGYRSEVFLYKAGVE